MASSFAEKWHKRRDGTVMVILFGATGMVGQGLLRECLRNEGVESALAVGRSSTAWTHRTFR